MDDSLRILIVDDSEDDALLIVRALRQAGYIPNYERVDAEASLLQALESRDWDIIIADHNMPHLDSSGVLKAVKAHRAYTPVIIVSGVIPENTAIAAMKAGAQDYIMKDNLARLIPAIERELAENQLRHSQRQAQSAVQHMTLHDALTGLPNRRAFTASIQNTLQQCLAKAEVHALLYLDLDQFKVINDTCDHIAGDTFLRQLTEVLKKVIRDTDELARLGGDEFGILLHGCQLADAREIAENILETVHQFRFTWQDASYRCTASIGLLELNKSVSSVDAAMSAADVACGLAKERGGNRLRLHQDSDSELTQRHGEMYWVAKITHSLENGRFMLYKQAILPTEEGTGRTKRWEFLLRLLDEDGAVLTPDKFIPAAERYNLMLEVDRWVLQKAFSYIQSQLASWDGLEDPGMYCINLSHATVNDATFYTYIRDLLQQYRIPAQRICFEITEAAAFNNGGNSQEFIRRVKEQGFRIALDDFGAGLSSFAYLSAVPVDFVKIDGSFVNGLNKEPVNYAIIEAINRIGHVAGLETIAELVENQYSVNLLREIGVDYMQGYYLERPKPLQVMPECLLPA